MFAGGELEISIQAIAHPDFPIPRTILANLPKNLEIAIGRRRYSVN
ncbi:MAG: hypothetical protein AB4290_05580 [Spirulina sp.]